MRPWSTDLGPTVRPRHSTGRWRNFPELVARLGHNWSHSFHTGLPNRSLPEETTFHTGPSGSRWHHRNCHQQQHPILTRPQVVGRHCFCTVTEARFHQRYSDLQRAGPGVCTYRNHQLQCSRAKLPPVALLPAHIQCQRVERRVDFQADHKPAAAAGGGDGHRRCWADHCQGESQPEVSDFTSFYFTIIINIGYWFPY